MLETDYSNYAVVYTCYSRFWAFPHDSLYVLTRQPAELGSKLWKSYNAVVLKAIKRAFLDPEEGKLRSDTEEYLVATE